MTDLDVPPSPELTRLASVPALLTLLADGQLWGLALPTPRYRPEVVPGVDSLGRPIETIQATARTGYPLAIERLVANLRTACLTGAGPESESRRFSALMALAVALLRRAHDLTLPAAVALLDLDGEGLARLVDAVLTTVAGASSDPLSQPDFSSTGGGNA